MKTRQRIELGGTRYVVIPEEEYDRLSRRDRLPALPDPLPNGNYPAVEFALAFQARQFILRREALGWSQAELARRSGVRVTNLNRIETGKVDPSLKTIDRLDRALSAAELKKSASAKKARKGSR